MPATSEHALERERARFGDGGMLTNQGLAANRPTMPDRAMPAVEMQRERDRACTNGSERAGDPARGLEMMLNKGAIVRLGEAKERALSAVALCGESTSERE